MESLLEEYKDHPVVKLIYFPKELNRTESLEKDLLFFYGSGRLKDLTNPKTMTPAVQSYVAAMKTACNTDPALLIAHSYSRYLGDLSGGQILSKRLKKHVLNYDDTTWDSSDGLNFYMFNHLGNQAEFKSFYRERLDSAKVNAITREEAIRSFELNIALFDEIQALSDAGKLEVSSYSSKLSKVKKEKDIGNNNRIYWAAMAIASAGIVGILIQRYFKHK
ncbi:hypothetical protein G6F56_011400 [Rhizopus delemar]|nr:hypothetical protein G6F56_011400 [Rhizopus delemar]